VECLLLTSVVKFVRQGYQNVSYESAGDEPEDKHFSLEVVVAGEADENSNKEYYRAYQLGKRWGWNKIWPNYLIVWENIAKARLCMKKFNSSG
jgi:hypothetical protein